ncbi:rhombosortase [Pseudomonadales bacterium]|nr:rhombosortase [Pseudomonadales bacterium]
MPISSSLSSLKPLLMLASVIALVLVVNGQFDNTELLRYERASFSEHWWQGFSHVLPHLNLKHLSLNLLALLCIAAIFGDAFKSFNWVLALAFSAMASAVGLYFFSPTTDWCVGLSGALHGLMVYAALRSHASIVWLLVIAGKIAIEQVDAFSQLGLMSVTSDYIGHAVIIDAHLWGAIGGLIFYTLVHLVQYILVFIEINSTRS